MGRAGGIEVRPRFQVCEYKYVSWSELGKLFAHTIILSGNNIEILARTIQAIRKSGGKSKDN